MTGKSRSAGTQCRKIWQGSKWNCNALSYRRASGRSNSIRREQEQHGQLPFEGIAVLCSWGDQLQRGVNACVRGFSESGAAGS